MEKLTAKNPALVRKFAKVIKQEREIRSQCQRGLTEQIHQAQRSAAPYLSWSYRKVGPKNIHSFCFVLFCLLIIYYLHADSGMEGQNE